jgi:hypothetical protein
MKVENSVVKTITGEYFSNYEASQKQLKKDFNSLPKEKQIVVKSYPLKKIIL